MGETKTKRREIDVIVKSIRSQRDRIIQLSSYSIDTKPDDDLPTIAEGIWVAIKELKVTIADARVVANPKALHHLLPKLVPQLIARILSTSSMLGRCWA
jgi:hypothetical protein